MKLTVSILSIILAPLILLYGCTKIPSKEDYKLNDGVYESRTGYSIHLDGETYKLCDSNQCKLGELYRGKVGLLFIL